MRPFVVYLVVAVAAWVPVPAQIVTATATATTNLTVRTPAGSRTFVARPLPAAGVELRVTRPGMNARTAITLDEANTWITYRTVDEWSVNSSYRGPFGGFGNGRHSTLLRLTPARTVAVRVRLSASSVAGAGSAVFGTVDVGNDGTIELAVVTGPRQVVEIPIRLGGPLDVAVTTGTSGSAVAGGGLQRARVDLTVQVLPAASCNPQRYLDTCEPIFSLAPTFAREIEFRVTSNLNVQGGFVMLGTLNFGVPLPQGVGCGFLALHPQVIVPAPFAAGAATISVPARGPRPIQFRSQGGVLADVGGTPQIYTTWAYLVSCP